MSWRDLAARVDQIAVRTFDYGGILFQKMDAEGVPLGEPVGIPADFDGAFKEFAVEAGEQAATMQPAALVHFADFPPGVMPEEDDRLIVAGGPHAATYVVASVEVNDDGSGGMLRLVKRAKT